MLKNEYPSIFGQIDINATVNKCGLTVEQINNLTCCSHKKIYWKCPEEHKYIASVASRTKRKSGCPYCSNHKVLTGYNDLLTRFPDIAKEYSADNPMPVNMIMPGTKEKVKWVCPKGHEYVASLNNRISKNYKCPYCSNKKLLTGYNDLLTKFPDIAKEYSKDNPIPVNKILAGTRKKVKWICPNGHEYITLIMNRTSSNKSGCPYCYNSKGENLISKCLNELNIKFKKQYVINDGKSNLRFDFYLLAHNVVIEFDGIQHFKPIKFFGGQKSLNENKKRDKRKNEYCIINNIKLLRIKYNEINDFVSEETINYIKEKIIRSINAMPAELKLDENMKAFVERSRTEDEYVHREDSTNRKWLDKSVMQAFKERMDIIFCEFDNISISFSGGKDSGVLLNLVMDYIKEHDIKYKPILFHQDMECQFTETTKYVERTFEKFENDTEPYWFCQPIESRNALSTFEHYWYPWDDMKKDLWIRDLPQHPYVYTLDNNPFDLYEYKMEYHDHADKFAIWITRKKGGKTVSLIGVRADESLNRFRAIVNKKHCYKNYKWTRYIDENTYLAYPIYDWTLTDIWTAIGKFGYEYNHIYDLYYKAGVPMGAMRVASPFHDDAKSNLNLYKVIDAPVWNKLLARVQGVSFAGIYGKTKATGFNKITLPPGYTWKKYTKFLLSTLPAAEHEHYFKKFAYSIQFWNRTGAGMDEEVITDLQNKGYKIKENGFSNYCHPPKRRFKFLSPLPDDTDDMGSTKDIPSWKRMCLCIIKNDYICLGMGYAPTKEQMKMINYVKQIEFNNKIEQIQKNMEEIKNDTIHLIEYKEISPFVGKAKKEDVNIRDTGGQYYGIYNNGQLVSFFNLFIDEKNKQSKFKDNYTVPEYRRRGYLNQFINFAIDESKKNGCKRMSVLTTDMAVSSHIRHGAVQSGKRENFYIYEFDKMKETTTND